MARKLFIATAIISLLAVMLLYWLWPPVIHFLWLIIPYIALGIYDMSSTHNVLRNYPVIGHLRYMFEFVSPEIKQYFIEDNQSGRPFSREMRSLIYQRAKGDVDTLPFGTQQNITDIGYELAYHSLHPQTVPAAASRITVGNDACRKPYDASRLNISAMSFGAISSNAVEAMNLGAKMGDFLQNTGEGGLTDYHLKHGGGIVWQVATGYFGCRTKDGHFDPEEYQRKACLDNVKMIEIKLSQGAKPSHGGILPAAKVDPQIAGIREVTIGEDCISPPVHSAFSTPTGLMQFVKQLRERSGGKPTGFKLCLGRRSEFLGICKAMLATGITPDFITIDGAEGGTGAAPLEFSNRLGTPIREAIAFAHNCLVGVNLRDKIRLIASGKVVTGFDIVAKIALGADMCNVARPMMFAVGCIQALRCNTNTCPTGVTTQDPRRVQALVVKEKCKHVMRFHQATIKSFLDITGALGVNHPDELQPHHIFRRIRQDIIKHYGEIYHYLRPGDLLAKDIHPYYASDWVAASADHF